MSNNLKNSKTMGIEILKIILYNSSVRYQKMKGMRYNEVYRVIENSLSIFEN